MKYFESFPTSIYSLDDNNNDVRVVTNILARTAFLRDIKNNVDVSYEYSVKDSDTPETVAFKEYGDAYRSWIILLFNNLINPNYDWPLKSSVLDDYIQNKYNQTIDEASLTIHHYEKVITKTQTINGTLIDQVIEKTIASEYDINYGTNKLTPAVLPTLSTPSIVSTETIEYPEYTLTIETKITAVSNYDNEVAINESKRKIRILDSQYVQKVETQFKELMRNG